MLKFVSNLISEMDIGPTKTRVGIGAYADSHRLHISITNSFTKDQLIRECANAPYMRGDAYLSRGLKGLRDQGLPGNIMREQVPRIAVLFTDGTSRHKQLTADNATLVKKDGIFLFIIGIGSNVDKDELRYIASDPKATFYNYVESFEKLDEIAAQLSASMAAVEILPRDKGTCGDNVSVDTVFVFDETAAGDYKTKQIRLFIKAAVDDFSVDSGNVRVGVVSKTCREGDIVLGQYVTKKDLLAGLENNGGPEISELVKRVRQSSFLTTNGGRSDAKRRIVVILHANVDKRDETMREVHRAKYAGIEIFVIQLGTNYDKAFINSLASKEVYTMYPGTADELLTKKSHDTFSHIFCNEL